MSGPDDGAALTPDMSYADYLQLGQLLTAQKPLSGQHDELLFIVIHQASELWLALSLHELAAAREHIRADDLGPAFKMIARVSRVQAQLIQSWDVLATMTPTDYHLIRPSLGQSSGFQSHQYRMLEFRLGGRSAHALAPHEVTPDIHALLQAEMATPSLYDEALRLLVRRGLLAADGVVDRDWSQPHQPNAAAEAAWLEVYRDPERWWDLYELAEKLVDLEFRFQQWRFAHMKTVERIIGYKIGTGGSSGVAYLGRALDQSFFPELLSVRTRL